jgi:hypothetical protein
MVCNCRYELGEHGNAGFEGLLRLIERRAAIWLSMMVVVVVVVYIVYIC